jgi:FkbM family methyltransferase
MAFERIKSLSRAIGVYPLARWFHRHVMDRTSLGQFRRERELLGQLVGPGDLCFDVGANVGLKAEVLLDLGARVIAFEPQADCLRELKARLGARAGLTTVMAAMGPSPGRGTFYRRDRPTTSGMVREWEGRIKEAISVRVTTLDECIVKYGVPRYCKVDVEGYEVQVFLGLTRPIETISFEFHLRDGGADTAVACVERLAGLGDYTANITLADAPSFVRPEWWNAREFRRVFPTLTAPQPGHDWGDIFLRLR